MRMSATEASRGFSRLLNRVAAGESIEVDRHGEVVGGVVPPARRMVSGAALLDLIDRLPRPDEAFADHARGLAVVSAAELLHGVHRATARQVLLRSAYVEGLLAAFAVLPIDLPVARVYAQASAILA